MDNLPPKSPKSPREKVSERLRNRDLEADGEYVVQQGFRRGSDGSDSAGSDVSQLKTTKDGTTVLIPQPSDDPEDPLNWSWAKKNLVFMTLLPGCFLTDWVITWGTTLFEAQAMTWNVSVSNQKAALTNADARA
jgi:hypothetical protein